MKTKIQLRKPSLMALLTSVSVMISALSFCQTGWTLESIDALTATVLMYDVDYSDGKFIESMARNYHTAKYNEVKHNEISLHGLYERIRSECETQFKQENIDKLYQIDFETSLGTFDPEQQVFPVEFFSSESCKIRVAKTIPYTLRDKCEWQGRSFDWICHLQSPTISVVNPEEFQYYHCSTSKASALIDRMASRNTNHISKQSRKIFVRMYFSFSTDLQDRCSIANHSNPSLPVFVHSVATWEDPTRDMYLVDYIMAESNIPQDRASIHALLKMNGKPQSFEDRYEAFHENGVQLWKAHTSISTDEDDFEWISNAYINFWPRLSEDPNSTYIMSFSFMTNSCLKLNDEASISIYDKDGTKFDFQFEEVYVSDYSRFVIHANSYCSKFFLRHLLETGITRITLNQGNADVRTNEQKAGCLPFPGSSISRFESDLIDEKALYELIREKVGPN